MKSRARDRHDRTFGKYMLIDLTTEDRAGDAYEETFKEIYEEAFNSRRRISGGISERR